MTERKSLLEQALDVCLYAPVGLAVAVTEELPQLIDKGRTRVNGQLAMAKMVGTFAVAQGQREAERVVRHATGRMWEGGPFAPGAPAGAPGDGAPTTASPPAGSGPDGVAAVTPPASPASASPAPVDAGAQPSAPPAVHPPRPGAGALAIPGYDALSASQVVQRLAGLELDELEAVRTYEAATRGRKTILNRIAQLQAPGPS